MPPAPTAGPYSDAAIEAKLTALRAGFFSSGLVLHLFQNDYTPTTSSVLGDFTEATFDGYASIAISPTSAVSIAAHVASFQMNGWVFTKGSGGTPNSIYGYYVTDSTNTTYYWGTRDPAAPVSLSVPGTTYTVNVTITDQSA